ncbi:AAA family ATPase [Herbiconiux sp. YIM B11900]|uniref:AAA family ATPase n=1 Tax=Herbiconiux sp. YIM B11900 TaxID=3404131 RepID=UPI003F8767E3
MKQLIITRGVPGAGKSQWAREWVAEDPASRARVNRDDIRMQLFGVHHGCDERAVTFVQNGSVRALMVADFDIVLDNTNLNPRFLKHLFTLAEHHRYQVVVKDFYISFDEAVLRDLNRDRQVGADVIRGFFDRYLKNGQFPAIDIPERTAA